MLVGGKDVPSYERPKPTFTVTEKDIPAIKEWEVGGKYTLEIEVEMVSHSKGDQYGPESSKANKQHEARLKILSFDEETGKKD